MGSHTSTRQFDRVMGHYGVALCAHCLRMRTRACAGYRVGGLLGSQPNHSGAPTVNDLVAFVQTPERQASSYDS